MSLTAIGAKRRTRNPRRRSTSFCRISTWRPTMTGPSARTPACRRSYVHTPVGVNQIAVKQGDSRGRGRSHAAGQAAAEFGGFAHRQEQRRQSGRGNAGDPLRAVGRGRDRGQADPEGRRLREQEHPVFRCRASWTIWAAPTAIWKACASASCTPSGRRKGRAARRARWACASAATARTATTWRRSNCSARSTT